MVDPDRCPSRSRRSRARLGATITPYVVPELRALYYLEKHFGTAAARAVHPHRARRARDPGELVGDERRRIAARRWHRDAADAHARAAPPPRPSQAPLTARGADRAQPTAPRASGSTRPRNREQIADAFVEYAKGRCDALVVLLIRDGNALGWRGYVAPPTKPTQPDRGAVAAARRRVGAAVGARRRPDVRRPAAVARRKPVETQLWAALGAEPEPVEVARGAGPGEAARGQPRLRAHARRHAAARRSSPSSRISRARAQTSYLRLIRQARGSVRSRHDVGEPRRSRPTSSHRCGSAGSQGRDHAAIELIGVICSKSLEPSSVIARSPRREELDFRSAERAESRCVVHATFVSRPQLPRSGPVRSPRRLAALSMAVLGHFFI